MQKREEIRIDKNLIIKRFSGQIISQAMLLMMALCALVFVLGMGVLSWQRFILPPTSLYYIGSDIFAIFFAILFLLIAIQCLDAILGMLYYWKFCKRTEVLLFDDRILINGLVIRPYYNIGYKDIGDSILLSYEYRDRPVKNAVDAVLEYTSSRSIYYRYKIILTKTAESEGIINALKARYGIMEYGEEVTRPIEDISGIGFYGKYSILMRQDLPEIFCWIMS